MTEEKNFEMNEINEQALEETAGGSKNYDYIHDLSRFIVRHVHGVVHYDSTSCLTMRKSPNGEVITAKSSTVTAGRTATRSWSTAPILRAAGSSLTREANTVTLTPTMYGNLPQLNHSKGGRSTRLLT